jgi:hypothetical protein
MRRILLVGSVLCLAALAPFAFATATGTAAETVTPETPAGDAAEPIAHIAVAAEAWGTCFGTLQPLGNGFGPWCGEPCSTPDDFDWCVGYDCGGFLRIDECTCRQGRWYCSWQNCPRW